MATSEQPQESAETGGQMTFFEHLVELRKRIINSLIAIAIGAFAGVYIAQHVIKFVTQPMLKALSDAHLDPKLIYTHPAGFFNLIITLGIYIGIVLASPVVLYQIWLFVAPALYKHERSAITGFLFSTVFLFLGGIAFGYFVTLPYILKFLVSFQGPVVPMISINEYFDLTLLVLMGLGLVFELPILVFFLSVFGIVTPKLLWKNIRYAILIIAIVAAIITPTPDAMTMLIFMAPMIGLYFVGIGVSAMVVRKKERQLAAAAETGSMGKSHVTLLILVSVFVCLVGVGVAGYKLRSGYPMSVKAGAKSVKSEGVAEPAASVVLPLQQSADDAPPAEKSGGFDGKRAFAHVAKQVGFGPRPSGSAAIGRLQEYIQSELASYGCKVDADTFTADTPVGRLPMKNIVAKIPGDKPGIIMLATHYDTKLLPNFVGADDAGSSTGLMLELARQLCGKKSNYSVWFTFFDGEEAVKEWSDTDSRYGSRQMAAKMAISGDLAKVKAFLLADIVGTRPPRFKRESDSTKWLVDLVWGVAKKLGYGDVFLDESLEVSDDHNPFLKRKVPAVDVIDLENYPGGNLYYWHTPEDTLDKVSAKSLAITGHVFLESVKQLQSK